MWLHEGEYGVIDFGMWWGGEAPVDTYNFELFVFVDFEPVEFGFVPVDPSPDGEPFPTLEEAQQVESLHKSVPLDVPRDEPVVFTLIIPPEAMGDPGAHDVRVVYTMRSEPNHDFEYQFRTSPDYKLTINYGGTDFVARDSLPQLEPEFVTPPDDRIRPLDRAGVLLEPPGSEGDFDVDELTRVHSIEENSEIRGWVLGLPGEPVQSVIAAFDGNRMLDSLRGQIALPAAPEQLYSVTGETVSNYAAPVSFTPQIEDDEVHTYRLFMFLDPFCRDDDDGGKTGTSNSIFLRR